VEWRSGKSVQSSVASATKENISKALNKNASGSLASQIKHCAQLLEAVDISRDMTAVNKQRWQASVSINHKTVIAEQTMLTLESNGKPLGSFVSICFEGNSEESLFGALSTAFGELITSNKLYIMGYPEFIAKVCNRSIL